MPPGWTEATGGFTRLLFPWEAKMQRSWYYMEDWLCYSIYKLPPLETCAAVTAASWCRAYPPV